MIKGLVLGTVFGGLTAFAWSTLSGEIQGWLTRPQAGAVAMEKVQKGPLEIMVETKPVVQPLVLQAVNFMAGAFVFTWLLMHTRELSYGRRVAFLMVVGLALSMMRLLANWEGLPGMEALLTFGNSVIMYLLMGLVIASVAKPN